MVFEGDVSKVALISVTQEGKSLCRRRCVYMFTVFFMDFVFLTSYHELESESNMNVVSEFLKFKFLMLMLLC